MKLESVRVKNYRCIDDSGWVPVEDLTCFVGRNESGKTSFLEAIENLNPAYGVSEYEPYEDYPRRDWREFDPEGDGAEIVVQAKLQLEEEDRDAVTEAYSEGVLADSTVIVGRDYANEFHWDLDLDQQACLAYLLDEYDFEEGVRSTLREAESLSTLSKADSGEQAYAAVVEKLGDKPIATLAQAVGRDVLVDRLPEFRYIGEYTTISGTIDIDELAERQEDGKLAPGDRAFLSLLTLADLDIEEFVEVENWREQTTALETVSAEISEEAMRYWSQSGDISIRIQHATSESGTDLLDLRVENNKHGVTVEFDQRSQGFRRFFSTFCQLSAIRESDRDLVVMVDEPGQSLHARAKEEFLQFLKTEIASRYTLLYTTHSPFMIDPETVHETKMVMADPIGEKNVFSDVTLADAATKFPLRNVFESDLMDTLLVTPYPLVVEEKADHIHLSVLSKLLEDRGTDGLDSRWTVVPIRNHRNITTFVGLFGEDRLDIAALLSEDPRAERSPTSNGTERELADIPIAVVSEYVETEGSTIEDLFSESFYLELVNRAYADAVKTQASDRIYPNDIAGDGPIVDRLERYFEQHEIADGSFDRNEPALYLQNNTGELDDELDKESVRAFTRLFRGLNSILTSFDSVEPRKSSLFDAFRPG